MSQRKESKSWGFWKTYFLGLFLCPTAAVFWHIVLSDSFSLQAILDVLIPTTITVPLMSACAMYIGKRKEQKATDTKTEVADVPARD